MRAFAIACCALLVAGSLCAQEAQVTEPDAQPVSDPNPQMILDTSEGVIVIDLFPDQAPLSVKNIIQYVEDGFYEGTIFHRVIPGFMVQGGGFGQDLVKKPVRDPVPNEADNGLKNDRGTVALARTSDPHSATAQFYINLIDNDSLNHRAKTNEAWGYAVIGQVAEGMNIVDRIARSRTQTRGAMRNVPALPIVIERATIRYPEPEAAD